MGRNRRIGSLVLIGSLLTWTMLVGFFVPTASGDLGIERHQAAGVVNLVPGAARGTITQPLQMGTIDSTGQTVFFAITDASDKDFAALVGAIRADSLAEAPDQAVETAIFSGGAWTFFTDPGRVTRIDTDDEDADGDTSEVLPPAGNPNYSPLKRLAWRGKLVTINAPFVWWGGGPGQQLIEDKGGCDPLIRSNPPSPSFVGGGPTDQADCTDEAPLARYKGGQVVSPDVTDPTVAEGDRRPGIDLVSMTVTMKLHKATFGHPDEIPYYTVFEASKPPPAGFMGVIHASKLGNLGRFGDNDAAGRIAQFSNGVRLEDGGPNRFQQGITSYRGGQQATYSPMWHITWIFFDCDGDGVFFDSAHNVGEGGTPVPAPDATFDPFAMDDKGVSCLSFAQDATGNGDGFIEDLNHLEELIEKGFAIQTEGPAGLRLGSTMQPPLIVNCPVPLTVR